MIINCNESRVQFPNTPKEYKHKLAVFLDITVFNFSSHNTIFTDVAFWGEEFKSEMNRILVSEILPQTGQNNTMTNDELDQARFDASISVKNTIDSGKTKGQLYDYTFKSKIWLNAAMESNQPFASSAVFSASRPLFAAKISEALISSLQVRHLGSIQRVAKFFFDSIEQSN